LIVLTTDQTNKTTTCSEHNDLNAGQFVFGIVVFENSKNVHKLKTAVDSQRARF
jgi:hypothetical protein